MPVDLGALDPKREADAAKSIKKQLELVKEAVALIERMKPLLKVPATKAKMGDISELLYKNDQIAQSDRLSALPNELKCNVWSFLHDPADRLMFALTCKWNAAMFESLKFRPEEAEQESTAKASKLTPKQKASKGSSDQERAKRTRKPTIKNVDRIPLLQRLQPWMPARYRLCYACLRFRRKDMEPPQGLKKVLKWHWVVLHLEPKGSRMTTKDVGKVIASGTRCAECVNREANATQAMKRDYKELRQTIKKMDGLGC